MGERNTPQLCTGTRNLPHLGARYAFSTASTRSGVNGM